MEPLLFILLSVVASALDDTGSSAEARSAMASFLGLNRTRRTLSPEGSCFGPRVVASGPVDAAGRLLQTPRLIWPKGQGPGGRWTVLSLFDGIGSAAVALQSLGVPVGRYLSVETDPSKNQVLHRHFPSIESAGDVRTVDPTKIGPVDLLIGGSPCTDLSVANPDREGLCGARSSLFWEFLRVLKATRPTWWIFENVDKLSEEDEATLTRELGVGPFVLDAGVVSAQRRVRLYWTNLTRVCVPTDRGRRLREVLLPYEAVGPDELRPAPERMSSIPKGTSRSYLEGGKGHAFLPDTEDKSPTLVRNLRRGSPYDVVVQGGRTRRLSPLEAERLQGFPDGYTAGLTRRLRLAGVGDAMSVPVLVHLLAHLGLAPARG